MRTRIRSASFAALIFLLAQSYLAAQSMRDYRRAGWDGYDAAEWVDTGLTPAEASWWASVFEPQLYLAPMHTTRHRVFAGIASELVQAGLTTELAQDWFVEFGDQRISYEEGRIYDSNYYSATDEFTLATEYLALGMSLDEAKSWRRERIAPRAADGWRRKGVSVENAARWRRAGAQGGYPLTFSLIDDLTRHGIDVDTYVVWGNFIDAYGVGRASEWIAAGFTPVLAATYEYAQVPIAEVDGIREACNGDPDATVNTVYLANPYSTESSCFFVEGSVHQHLDRTTALATHPRDPGRAIIVNFAPALAPGERTTFTVLAKGRKPYTYTTVRGDERIVANLAVIKTVNGSP
jgi:hypothetical protein